MHTWIIYEWEKNASWWIKKSLIFPIGGAKEHLMHPTFYCFNISWLRIVSKRHQWLAIFNQPDFVALVDDSKTNRWENHRAKKKGKKEKPTATRHSSTKGVSMCGRMVTMMSLKSSAEMEPLWAWSRWMKACRACSSCISCRMERWGGRRGGKCVH